MDNDRAVLNAAANVALDPIANGNKPSYGFMVQIMDLENKNIIVDAIALGVEVGDSLEIKKMEIKIFPDFEKLGLDGSVDSLEIFRDLNNSKIDDLLGQANQAMHPPQQ